MSNKKRLGTIPKGLEWIEQTPSQPAATDTSSLHKKENVSDLYFEASRKPRLTSAHRGLPAGWRRATLIMREEHFNKLKAMAYWDRTSIKEILDEALEIFLRGKHIKSLDIHKKK